MQAVPQAPKLTAQKHVAGLDSIRFVCAAWVLFGHFGFFPVLESVGGSGRLSLLVRVVFGNLFSGPAAVIVFFVISGFCIHYPYRDGAPLPLKAYYSRRYVRILVPMALAVALGVPLGLELTRLNDSILWSLLAEEIYYLLYPLVLVRLRRRFGWRPIIGVAYVLGVLVVLTEPRAGNYASYGPGLNWLLGLPCWLLGCALAESLRSEAPSAARMWTFRLGIWGLSSALGFLRFHSPLGHPWTLNAFALVVFFWLGAEIAYQTRHGAVRWLESAGKFSYSVYLMHLHGHALFLLLGLSVAARWLDWTLATAFTYLVCYAFYRLVEKPSHELARRVARRILERPVATATAV